MCGLAITLNKWNDWMEVNGGMTCKPKLPLLFSSHDDLRYSVSPGSCHPLWHRSHRRKSHIWHRRSHGLCDRPWRTLCTHLPHPPSYRCDSGTCRMKRTRTRLCIVHQQLLKDRMWPACICTIYSLMRLYYKNYNCSPKFKKRKPSGCCFQV